MTDRDIDNFSAKVDISHPFEFANLSYGGKITYTNSVYSINNNDELAGRIDIDEFKYIENIQAAYVNVFKQLSEKWKIQLGLRAENTTTEGISRSLNISNNFDYFKLFPTVYLTYQPNDNNTFSINYGRRINRPYFSRLNPASFFINQSTRSVGNPFLQPSFSDNFEFTHLYKGRLTSTAFFEAETDGIGTVAIADNDTFEQVISSYNYFTLYRMGLSESYNLRLTPWWDSNNSVYLVYYISEITNDLIQAPVQDNFSYYLSTDHSFVLNKAKTHRAQLSYWYSGPFTINQTENDANQALNISLRSQFFDKKLQLAFSALDIFNTSPRISTSDVNGVVSTFISRGIFRGRGFRISLNYSFGNDEINVRQRREGNTTEQRRAN
ncbi:MAG: outer membrane beta-barrel family protein [Bacteroidota bacterium]